MAAVGFFLVREIIKHAQSARCSNQMHVILYASVYDWPAGHKGCLPDNFLSMSNELVLPKLLFCPSDASRRPAANWFDISADNCSYELVTTNLHKGDTNQVFIRCPIHGYVGYADGRLLDKEGHLVKPNRTW